MAEADVLRRVAIEALRAATQSPEERAACAAAEAVGRRAGERLGGSTAAEAARALGLDTAPAPVPPAVAEAFLRGLSASLASGPAAATAVAGPPRPASPWGVSGKHDLVAATRRAMHDLNQPLTVILGYAAILKRAGAESVRMEAAEQIVKEARKMNEIITGLSRLARGLDAA